MGCVANPASRAWPQGAVVELSNVSRELQRLADATRPVDPEDPRKWLVPQVAWKHNGLRHSF
jgi:hypothetical protein